MDELHAQLRSPNVHRYAEAKKVVDDIKTFCLEGDITDLDLGMSSNGREAQ